MKLPTWLLIVWTLVVLGILAAYPYPFVFHCSYGWDVEQMRIACEGEGE